MEAVASALMCVREEIAEERECISIGADYVSEGAWRSHVGCARLLGGGWKLQLVTTRWKNHPKDGGSRDPYSQ